MASSPESAVDDLGPTADRGKRANDERRKSDEKIGPAVTRLGFVDEQGLLRLLSQQYGVPACDLSNAELDPEFARVLPKDLAIKHHLVTVNVLEATVIVALADPSNISAVDAVAQHTGKSVEVVVALEREIEEAIKKLYG